MNQLPSEPRLADGPVLYATLLEELRTIRAFIRNKLAPYDAQYILLTADATDTLFQGRRLASGTNINLADAGAGSTLTIATTGVLASSQGTYAPTGTAGTNVASLTTYLSMYTQVGAHVFVSGRVEVSETGAGACGWYLTLPVASNLADVQDLCGVGSDGTTPVQIKADVTDNRAQCYMAVAPAQDIYFQFAYIVK